ncbi:MAG: FAD-dependent oxidoreductase [Acidobacteriota bacterium]|nr:FAD-dependent oxidoreductase [Acidobacteriota bacterium]
MAPTEKQRAASILLVGLGRFGREHLKVWQSLEARGSVRLAGAVVGSEESRVRLSRIHEIPIWAGLKPSLLENVDGVDIVAPTPMHCKLAMECLQYANVLVEKPLASCNADAQLLRAEAERRGRLLMVNHLYRFHPIVRELKTLLANEPGVPRLVSGIFVNPLEPGVDRLCPNLEMLHYFDVLDFLFERRPAASFTERIGCVNHVGLRYPGGINALFELGWRGSERIRTLDIAYARRKFSCDFLFGSIEIRERKSLDRLMAPHSAGPLSAALESFASALNGTAAPNTNARADATTGLRIIDVARFAAPRAIRNRPRVAVLGGGIFGASCAIELARHCDVTLFERHSELLTEASYLNQWRHHSGFHYPRSLRTVQEIQATRDDFDSVYNLAIERDVPSYYCTSAHGREITRERYLSFCSDNRLAFSIEDPPSGLLNRDRVTLCIRTDEAVFNFYKLRDLVRAQLAGDKNIRIEMESEVADASIERDGSKVLGVLTGSQMRRETYDYLVNATYSNNNLMAKWFRFPVRPLRFDLCEMLVLELPLPKISITILDGPFTSLVSTGERGTFILSHMIESVLKSRIPRDGLPPDWGPVHSNRERLIQHCARYLPMVQHAKILESRFSTRAVAAFSEDFDGRPTTVTSHGFGCWSVLGGKIATCVTNAKEIAAGIMRASA